VHGEIVIVREGIADTVVVGRVARPHNGLGLKRGVWKVFVTVMVDETLTDACGLICATAPVASAKARRKAPRICFMRNLPL